MVILENEPLCHHTTLRTGGPARFLARAASVADIGDALRLARQRGLPVFVLGHGTNILAGDAGFEGVVIKMETTGIRAGGGESCSELIAEAGEEWDALVAHAVRRGLFGLENMSLIPGTVGAAVVGNIGAYGREVRDTLRWVEALDTATGRMRRFPRSDCAFAYRHSHFKTPAGRAFIVLRAAFGLKTTGTPDTRYKDLREKLAGLGLTTPSLADVRQAIVAIRQAKLPDPAQVGTAGSFFKNPAVTRAHYEKLAARYPGLPGHEEEDGTIKIPLGWVLDKVCGLKGVRRGRVGTHAGQALVLVNEGGTASEIETFARETAQLVYAKTDISIEWEVVRL